LTDQPGNSGSPGPEVHGGCATLPGAPSSQSTTLFLFCAALTWAMRRYRHLTRAEKRRLSGERSGA
jgi:hypothetical protein